MFENSLLKSSCRPEIGEFFLLDNVVAAHGAGGASSSRRVEPLVDAGGVEPVPAGVQVQRVHVEHVFQTDGAVVDIVESLSRADIGMIFLQLGDQGIIQAFFQDFFLRSGEHFQISFEKSAKHT